MNGAARVALRSGRPKGGGGQLVTPLLAGLLIAALATILMSNLRPVIVLLFFGTLVLALPTLIIQHPKRYWLVVFVLALLLDVSKRLTTGLADPLTLLIKFGFPPSGNLSIHLYPSDLVLFALTVPWLLGVVVRKQPIHVPRVTWLIVAYLAWALVTSLANAPSLYLAAFEFVRQLVYLLIFLYIANNVDSPRLLRGVRFACLTGLLLESVAIIVTFQMGSYAAVFEKAYRAPKVEIGALSDYRQETKPGEKVIVRSRGTFGHPSSAAQYLELMLPLALALWLARSRWQTRIQYLALFIAGWGALLMTFSRAALVGGAFGVACTVWITRHRRLCSQGEFRAISITVALLALALAPSLEHYLTLRPQAFAFRFPLMRVAVDMWWKSPIAGVGLNNSSASNPDFRLKDRGEGAEGLVVVHNQYLITAIDTGIVGLALYLSIFVVLGVKAWRASRSRDPDIACFAIGILCSWLGLGLHVLADPFAGNTLLGMLWMYAGLIAAFEQMERARNEPVDQTPRRLSVSSPSSPATGARSGISAEQLGGASSARPRSSSTGG